MKEGNRDADRAGSSGGVTALPAELNRAVPRPVRLTAAGKVVAVAAVLAVAEAAWLGTWLYEVAHRSQAEAAEMRRQAAKANAVVTATGRVGNERTRIHYHFAVGGKGYRGSFTVPKGRRQAYSIGSSLEVAYLPSRPEKNWPVGREPQGIPSFVGPLAAATALALAAGLGLWLRGQRRLLEDGRAVVATIQRVERVRGKGARYRVHYKFPLLSGARQLGQFDLSRDPAPAPGTHLVVIYDPDNPRRQRRYPFPLVRVSPD